MKGRLRGKKIAGFLWAEPWQRKENYFQLEHDKLVTAVLACPSGSLSVRCAGSSCEISMHKKRQGSSDHRLNSTPWQKESAPYCA